MGRTVAHLLRMPDDELRDLLHRFPDATIQEALQAVQDARDKSYKRTPLFYQIGRRTSAVLNPYFI